MFNVRTVALAATLAVTGAAATAPPNASAKGGPGVRVTGVCTKSATAQLKLSRDNGRVEVEFEVDQNRNGIPWKVTYRRSANSRPSVKSTCSATPGSQWGA
jgi:hypothetical protein